MPESEIGARSARESEPEKKNERRETDGLFFAAKCSARLNFVLLAVISARKKTAPPTHPKNSYRDKRWRICQETCSVHSFSDFPESRGAVYFGFSLSPIGFEAQGRNELKNAPSSRRRRPKIGV